MSDQATIWLALEGELITAVEGVTPNKAPSQPFKWRGEKAHESTSNIEAAAGGSRIFHFNPPGPDIPNVTIGHTSRIKDLEFELQIIYQGGPIWAVYAADDADKIAHTIRAASFTNADFVNPILDKGSATLEPLTDEEGGSHGWVLTVPFFAPVHVS